MLNHNKVIISKEVTKRGENDIKEKKGQER